MKEIYKSSYLSGHMHRGSAYETDDSCGNCDGVRCDNCERKYNVTELCGNGKIKYLYHGSDKDEQERIYTKTIKEMYISKKELSDIYDISIVTKCAKDVYKTIKLNDSIIVTLNSKEIKSLKEAISNKESELQVNGYLLYLYLDGGFMLNEYFFNTNPQILYDML